MKTVIWDYNGTIIDDLELCLNIENEMLEERNMRAGYTKEEYRNLFCFPVIEYYYKLGYTFENETYEDISVIFNKRYDEGFPNCKLIEGSLEKLQESYAKGNRNVILSAARHDKLIEQTDALDIGKYFEERMGIDNLLAGSKVDMAKRWMKERDINPDDCIYIGDTEHDKETADAIGITDCFLVACGHQSYEVLSRTGAKVVRSMKEVLL